MRAWLVVFFMLGIPASCWATISAVTASANTGGSTAGGNFTLTSPGGVQAGDLLVVVVAAHSNLDNVTKIADTATGTLTFTKQTVVVESGASEVYMWYRVFQTGDPTGAGGWTVTSSVNTQAAIMAYRGVDNNSPIDAAGSSNTNSSASATFNAVTAATQFDWYVGVASFNSASAPDISSLSSGSPTPNIRSDTSNGGTNSTKQGAVIMDANISNIGSTGTFVYALSTSVHWATYEVCLKPSATGATATHSVINGSSQIAKGSLIRD